MKSLKGIFSFVILAGFAPALSHAEDGYPVTLRCENETRVSCQARILRALQKIDCDADRGSLSCATRFGKVEYCSVDTNNCSPLFASALSIMGGRCVRGKEKVDLREFDEGLTSIKMRDNGAYETEICR